MRIANSLVISGSARLLTKYYQEVLVIYENILNNATWFMQPMKYLYLQMITTKFIHLMQKTTMLHVIDYDISKLSPTLYFDLLQKFKLPITVRLAT